MKENKTPWWDALIYAASTTILVVGVIGFFVAVLPYFIFQQEQHTQINQDYGYQRGFSDCKQQGVGDMKQFIEEHTSCLVKLNGTQAQCKIVLNYGVG